MELFTHPWSVWALVGLALMVLEFILPGLVVFFFGLGALLVAVISSFADISLTTQLIIFIAASITFFLTLRRCCRTIFRGGGEVSHQGVEDRHFTGTRVKVVEAIAPATPGKVEMNGTLWSAEAPESLGSGEWAEVTGRDNLTLRVRRSIS
jgi:membrane protein implicated in regulation of membrane protease activity